MTKLKPLKINETEFVEISKYSLNQILALYPTECIEYNKIEPKNLIYSVDEKALLLVKNINSQTLDYIETDSCRMEMDEVLNSQWSFGPEFSKTYYRICAKENVTETEEVKMSEDTKSQEETKSTVKMFTDSAFHGFKVAAVDEGTEVLLEVAQVIFGDAYPNLMKSETGKDLVKMVSALAIHAGCNYFPDHVPGAENIKKVCELVVEGSSRDFIQPRIKALRPAFDKLAKMSMVGNLSFPHSFTTQTPKVRVASEEYSQEIDVEVQTPETASAHQK